MALVLLGTGHETTANMLALSTFALLENPAELARLRDDPELLDTAIEELLRSLSIIQLGVSRVATEDLTIGDVTIPAGVTVIIATPRPTATPTTGTTSRPPRPEPPARARRRHRRAGSGSPPGRSLSGRARGLGPDGDAPGVFDQNDDDATCSSSSRNRGGVARCHRGRRRPLPVLGDQPVLEDRNPRAHELPVDVGEGRRVDGARGGGGVDQRLADLHLPVVDHRSGRDVREAAAARLAVVVDGHHELLVGGDRAAVVAEADDARPDRLRDVDVVVDAGELVVVVVEACRSRWSAPRRSIGAPGRPG